LAAGQLSLVRRSDRWSTDQLPLEQWPAFQAQLIENFLISRRATVSRQSVRVAVSALRANLLPWLQAHHRFVWNVSPEDLDEWAVALRNCVATRTHTGYFAAVACFYDWLVVRQAEQIERLIGVSVRNPVDRFNRARRLSEGERLVPVPREATIRYFLAFCRKAIDLTAGSDIKWLQACRSYTMWLVLNWAGLRRAELAALNTQDVDLEAGIIQVVDGKGHRGRHVQIQPRLAPTLRWFVQEIRPQMVGHRERVLFLSSYGRCFSPGALSHLLHVQQVAAHVAIEDQFTAHGFRRAFATRLYKDLRTQRVRDPLVFVQHQLGHEYLSTTQRYCQLDDDFRHLLAQEAASALVELYRRQSGDA
jgi:site-specific recombinase XerD